MSIQIPSVIRTRAVIEYNGFFIHSQGDITLKRERQTSPTPTDWAGNIGDTFVSETVSVDFQPAGMIRDEESYYPWGPSSIVAASSVGSSLYSKGTLKIHTPTQVIIWERAGMITMPSLSLNPRTSAFGSMGFKCLGKAATAPTDTKFWKEYTSATYDDSASGKFDTSMILKGLYSATYNSVTYGARSGFEIRPFIETTEVTDDNIGVVDDIITSIGCECTFSPNNKAEADIDTLMRSQGVGAMLPGQFMDQSTLGDLIIGTAGEPLIFTLHNAGITSAAHGYGTGADRNQEVRFVARQTFTAGVASPLFSIAFQ